MSARDFRPHAVLAFLLIAALVWVYALSRPDGWPQGGTDRPVPLWPLNAEEVARVEFSNGASRVVLRVDPDLRLQDGSAALWIEAEGPAAAPEAPPVRPQGPPPAAPTGSSDASPTPRASQRASFRGGQGAANWLHQLFQVSALRDLGRPDAKQLQAFGLDKPAGTLRVMRPAPDKRAGQEQSGALQLDLGLVTYGGATRYAALQPGGRVYLVPASLFPLIEHPRRLMDREWVPFNLFEAGRIDVKIGSRTLSVYRVEATPPPPQRWSLKAGAPQGDPNAQVLVQTLMGMKVADYPGLAAVPAGSETQLEVAVYRAAASPAAGSPAPAEEPLVLRVYKASGKAEEVRAVSPYTVVPVTLTAASVQAVLERARALLATK